MSSHDICNLFFCDNPQDGPKGLCKACYRRAGRGNVFPAHMMEGTSAGWIGSKGYRKIRHYGKKRFEHIVIAEHVLGKDLPPGAQIHHVNGDPADNRNCNLVICPSNAYHNLIHTRQRAFEATGDPDAVLCWHCGEYGADWQRKGCQNGYHLECNRRYQRERYAAKKAATKAAEAEIAATRAESDPHEAMLSAALKVARIGATRATKALEV